MTPRLLKAFRLDCDLAAKTLRSRGAVPQMFTLRTHDRRIIPMLVAGGDRDDTYRMVRLAIIAHDVEVVTSIGEAWTLPPGPSLPDVLPSQSERRIEIVAVQMMTLEEMTGSAREIIRDADGRATGLGPERLPQKVFPARDFGGELSRLIPRERPGAANRAMALALLEHFTKQPAAPS
jgi:hypothetical protein